MGAFPTLQVVLAVLAIVVAFALGFAFRARLGAGTRQARKAESDQKLDLVLWSTGDEFWEMDMAKDTFTRTNPLKHMYLTSYNVVQAASTLRSEVAEEDRAAFDGALVAHFKGQSEYLDMKRREYARQS